MRGRVYTYRGRFRVYFSYHGEKFWLNKYLDGSPLVHELYAQRLLEHVNSLMDTGRFDPSEWRKDRPYSFEKAIQVWVDLSTCSQEWLEHRENFVKKFMVPFFGEIDIREVKTIHIDRFHVHLKKQSYSSKYIYNILGELKAFFRAQRDSIPKLPSFPRITPEEPRIRWIDEEAQEQIFEFIPEEDRPVFIFMRYTGCRPNEAGGLLRDNVDMKLRQITLVTVLGGHGQIKKRTKTGKLRILPVIPQIEDCLKPREATPFIFSKHGRPYSKKMLERVWDRANAKATEKYKTPRINLYNGLKHSFGCQRLNAGYSLDEIKAVMGHSDKRTTEKYAKYLTQKLSAVMTGKVRVLGEVAQTLHGSPPSLDI